VEQLDDLDVAVQALERVAEQERGARVGGVRGQHGAAVLDHALEPSVSAVVLHERPVQRPGARRQPQPLAGEPGARPALAEAFEAAVQLEAHPGQS
jgi:hypothetical protein